MRLPSSHFVLSCLFAFALWSRAPCSAQDGDPAPAVQTPTAPLSPLAGPRAAVAVGAVLFTAAPIVGLSAFVGVQLDGPNNWLGCEGFDGHTDAECEQEEIQHAREVERALPPIIVGSTLLGLGGLALGIWGITRIVRVRREQRRLQFDSAGLELDGARPARLALRFRF
jgi:hypothetical protein